MGLGLSWQGHLSSGWQSFQPSEYKLPTLIQMGQEYAFKRDTNHWIDSELVWHNKMACLVQKAFQPRSYAAAMACLLRPLHPRQSYWSWYVFLNSQ